MRKQSFRKLALVTSVSLLALSVVPFGHAQTLPTVQTNMVELSAENLEYDENAGLIIATGKVYLNHKGYELFAEKVTYFQKEDKVRAEGNIRMTSPDGEILMMDTAELNESLSQGFVENVRLLLADNSRLAALSGRREANNITTLEKAVYTPCEICRDNEKKRPVWQLKAVKIVHDQNKKKLIYTDAFLELFGIPVLYTPYLSHPDPTVKRASGFLTPDIQTRRELGLVVALPYYHVIDDSSDLTITPTLTTNEGAVLGAEYRKHVGLGQFRFGGSATYPKERDDNAQLTGDRILRGHVYSDGQFNLGNGWLSNYKMELASDDTYLRRYGYSDLDTLENRVTIERFDGRSYFGASSIFFQGLRQEDVAGLTGHALPMVTYDYVSVPDKFGGVTRFGANALVLGRTDGMDTMRLTGSGSWEVPYINQYGQIFQFKGATRIDGYQINDAERPDNPFFAGKNGFEGRILPHLEASFKWPLVKVGDDSQQMLEPLVTVVAAPSGGNPDGISNEDSRTFELTDTNLFSAQRFPGYDRWEGGVRATYGMKWSISRDGVDSEVMLGQSYRLDQNDNAFPEGSGLSGNFSDFVGKWDLSVKGLMRLAHRFRFDKDNFVLRRNEVDAYVGDDENWLSVGYFQLNRDREEQGLEDREEVRMAGNVKLKQYWYLHGDVTQNLTDDSHGIGHSIGIKYIDDCLEIGLAWRKSYTFDRDIVPGSTFLFKIRLKQLG